MAKAWFAIAISALVVVCVSGLEILEPVDWRYHLPRATFHFLPFQSPDHPLDLDSDVKTDIVRGLTLLFPQMDVNQDNFVSLQELRQWLQMQAESKTMKNMETVLLDFENSDRDGDGFLSFDEVYPGSLFLDVTNLLKFSDPELERWLEMHVKYFDSADVDRNAKLNQAEFMDYMHPEMSGNRELRMWRCKEEVYLSGKDEKINMDQFNKRLSGRLGLAHEEEIHEKFGELDVNKDGFLTEDELEPIIDELDPSVCYYAEKLAQKLLKQVDDDGDGGFTLEEMVAHPYTFYTAGSNA